MNSYGEQVDDGLPCLLYLVSPSSLAMFPIIPCIVPFPVPFGF